MKIRGITVGTPIKPEKNLVKATGLSAEEQAQARENIGAASAEVLGDIEAALDAIIAIQEELIAGGGSVEEVYCPSCGGAILLEDGSAYCDNCGIYYRKCVNCGELHNMEGPPMCDYCGGPVVCPECGSANYSYEYGGEGPSSWICNDCGYEHWW